MEPLSELGRARAIEIIELIEQVRDEHQACTAREISRRLKLAHTVLVARLGRLREYELVDWTDLTGSLHVTEAGEAWIDEVRAAEGKPKAVRKPRRKRRR